MAAKTPDSERAELSRKAPIHSTVDRDAGIVQRWRERSAERKRARLVSGRSRRFLANWLRSTANRGQDPDSTLIEPLHYRTAAVRTELLELAAILEHTVEPDPASVTDLRDLLADSRGSPLYNPNVSAARLDEVLQRIRAGLVNGPPT